MDYPLENENMTTEKNNTYHYPFIVEWGKIMGSSSYYIEEEIKRARRDGAPKNAVYKQSEFLAAEFQTNSGWATMDTVSNPDIFTKMGLPVPDRLRYYVYINGGISFANKEDAEKLYDQLARMLPMALHVHKRDRKNVYNKD